MNLNSDSHLINTDKAKSENKSIENKTLDNQYNKNNIFDNNTFNMSLQAKHEENLGKSIIIINN